MHTSDIDRLFVAVLPLLLALITVINLLPTDWAIFLVKENSVVENLTALGFLLAAGWLYRAAWQQQLPDGYSAGSLVLALALRELDFHTRFTTMGVFKTKYYLSSQVPGGEKLAATIVVLLLGLLALRYLYRQLPPFFQALRRRQMYAVALTASLATIAVSKMLDSLSDPIEPLVALFSAAPRTVLRITEENLELAIPLYLLLALAYYFQASKRTRSSSQ